jgi:hypothetical protein
MRNYTRIARRLQDDCFASSGILQPLKKAKKFQSSPKGATLYCAEHGMQIATKWDRLTGAILLDCGCTRTKSI